LTKRNVALAAARSRPEILVERYLSRISQFYLLKAYGHATTGTLPAADPLLYPAH
jgi:hypothetical protein